MASNKANTHWFVRADQVEQHLVGLLLGPRLETANEWEDQLIQLVEGVLGEVGDHHLGQVCHKVPAKDADLEL